MTRSWLDAIERSWLLKLAWLCVPFVPLTALAVSKHLETDSGLVTALPAIVVLGGAVLPFAVGLLTQPAKKARHRALSPLHRAQMSDEADVATLTDTLRIDEKPPVESLPYGLQYVIAAFGAPLPGILSRVIGGLGLIFGLSLLPMAVMTDPIGALSRWTGQPLSLAYWPTYAALLSTALLFTLWRWLRQMHDHYVAVAQPGRRPFPDLR